MLHFARMYRKKNKAVILLSTMHSDTAVNVDEQKKPNMIMYYNKYKTGVDTMDQMVRRYTCHRRTQRCLIYYENNNMLKKKTN